jgi:hypothetical protein
MKRCAHPVIERRVMPCGRSYCPTCTKARNHRAYVRRRLGLTVKRGARPVRARELTAPYGVRALNWPAPRMP